MSDYGEDIRPFLPAKRLTLPADSSVTLDRPGAICVTEVSGWDSGSPGTTVACPLHIPGHIVKKEPDDMVVVLRPDVATYCLRSQVDPEDERYIETIGTGPCHAPSQCCFCGAVHAKGEPKGYAGEKHCGVCGKGGNGEPDEPGMFYKRAGMA